MRRSSILAGVPLANWKYFGIAAAALFVVLGFLGYSVLLPDYRRALGKFANQQREGQAASVPLIADAGVDPRPVVVLDEAPPISVAITRCRIYGDGRVEVLDHTGAMKRLQLRSGERQEVLSALLSDSLLRLGDLYGGDWDDAPAKILRVRFGNRTKTIRMTHLFGKQCSYGPARRAALQVQEIPLELSQVCATIERLRRDPRLAASVAR
jgi:hypothetical protein